MRSRQPPVSWRQMARDILSLTPEQRALYCLRAMAVCAAEGDVSAWLMFRLLFDLAVHDAASLRLWPEGQTVTREAS